jgi:hypothetical protein
MAEALIGFEVLRLDEYDDLDREYGEKIAALIRELQREQARVLYGQQGVDLIDREDAERASTETHEERR